MLFLPADSQFQDLPALWRSSNNFLLSFWISLRPLVNPGASNHVTASLPGVNNIESIQVGPGQIISINNSVNYVPIPLFSSGFLW